jgi:four helix bundle protein
MGSWSVYQNSIIETKSFDFAVRIVKLYQYLAETKKEFVLAKQLLRSGTSIGANVAEAMQASSPKDFIFKLNISLKEASETKYWLQLLKATNYLTEQEFSSIYPDCIEIEKILYSIIRTSKAKQEK